MNVKFIRKYRVNEDVFGNYKHKNNIGSGREERIAKVKKDTVAIVKKVVYKEFRDKFIKICDDAYNDEVLSPSGSSFKKRYDEIELDLDNVLLDWLDMGTYNYGNDAYGDIEIMNGRPCYLVYVSPKSSNMHHWIYDDVIERLEKIENDIKMLLLSKIKMQELYKEYSDYIQEGVLDLKFKFFPNNSIEDEKEELQNGDSEGNTIEELLNNWFINKEYMMNFYDIIN